MHRRTPRSAFRPFRRLPLARPQSAEEGLKGLEGLLSRWSRPYLLYIPRGELTTGPAGSTYADRADPSSALEADVSGAPSGGASAFGRRDGPVRTAGRELISPMSTDRRGGWFGSPAGGVDCSMAWPKRNRNRRTLNGR